MLTRTRKPTAAGVEEEEVCVSPLAHSVTHAPRIKRDCCLWWRGNSLSELVPQRHPLSNPPSEKEKESEKTQHS